MPLSISINTDLPWFSKIESSGVTSILSTCILVIQSGAEPSADSALLLRLSVTVACNEKRERFHDVLKNAQ